VERARVGGAVVTVLEAVGTVTISMGLPCDHDSCETHAMPLFEQLSVPKYSRAASVMAVPDTLEEWRAEHRTARRRALRAERLGYVFAEVSFADHSDDIFVINTSMSERQGRPMSDGYTHRRQQGPLQAHQTLCERHRTHTYGVLKRGKLVAYMTLHRSGDLAMVSMILGHAEHFDAGIMFLLVQGAVGDQAGRGGFFFYNLHSSGQDGLRWAKERYGFRPADIEWSLS
jgi:hypothetical protein